MSQPITTSRAASPKSSIASSSPALLTPSGSPPVHLPSSSGLRKASFGANYSGFNGQAGQAGSASSQSYIHSSSHGRFNPFSEGRLQQLLSPFEAGASWGGGDFDLGDGYKGQAQGQGHEQGQAMFDKRPLPPPATVKASTIGTGGMEGEARDMMRRKSMPEGESFRLPSANREPL